MIPESPRQLNVGPYGSPSNFSDDSVFDSLPESSVRAAVHEAAESPEAYLVPLAQVKTSSSSKSASAVASSAKIVDSTSQPEDGPLFRATVASLEKKTASLKNVVKKLLKRTVSMHEAQEQYCASYVGFLDSLREASKDLLSFRPAVDSIFDTIGKDLVRYEKRNSKELNSHIIEPLRRLYDGEIKAAEAKKREFDDDSKEYYAWLGRYLSMKQEVKGKKKVESDTKYQDKRKIFELKRFDYFTFIQDLHGGRKENETSYQLSAYIEIVINNFEDTFRRIQNAKPQINNMLNATKETKEEWDMRRLEREEKRRALERSAMPEPGQAASNASVSTSAPAGNDHGKTHRRETSVNLAPVLDASSAVKSSSLESPSEETEGENQPSDHRKESLLWAMSRPGGHNDPRNLNKPGWHKFWVVLAGGQLCEYTNWKQSVELHNEPINLRMASVREARGADRRFCFEVITLQYRRVYQATSEEDMHSWINAISNAISSTIEGTEPQVLPHVPADIVQSSSMKNLAKIASGSGSGQSDLLFPKPNPATPIRRTSPSNGRPTVVTQHLTDTEDWDDSDASAKPLSSISSDSQSSPVAADKHGSLIRRVREADPANSLCADCGSSLKVEWVSINLMTIVCIECSGLHRSLGTHISKMRSLTLDMTSFTADFVDSLLNIGNNNANMIWEALPEARSTKEELQKVIAEQQQLQLQHQHLQNQGRSPQLPSTTAGGSASGSSAGPARQARLSFITRKYVDRAFVAPVPQPNFALRVAVRNQDIVDVMHALASGGNPNATTQSSSATSTSSSSSSASILSGGVQPYPIFLTALVYAGRDATTFGIAELLVQHGAKIPREVPAELRLSSAATEYMTRKQGKPQSDEGKAQPVTTSMLLEGTVRFPRKTSLTASRLHPVQSSK